MNEKLKKLMAAQIAAMSEYRAAVNGDKDESVIDKLSAALDKADTELRDALNAKETDPMPMPKPEPQAGDADSKLINRAKLSRYLGAALEGRSVDGAEAELNKELKLPSDHIPFAALAPTQSPLELRADAATDVAAANMGRGHRGIISRVFAQSVSSHLGIMMPPVLRGDAVYSVLTAGTSAANQARGGTQDATAATFTASTLSPTRITARYLLNIEDMARLEGLEESLRNDLRGALSEQLDNQILNGDGTAPNFTGLLTTLSPKADTDTTTFATAKGHLAGGVDGKYAGMMNQIKMAVSPDTFTTYLGLENSGSGENAYEYMQRVGGGIIVSSLIPAKTWLRTSRGMEAVAPVWDGVQLIRDNTTAAASGQVALTVIMLASFALLRADAWKAGKFKA